MSRKLIGAVGVALIAAAALGACQKKVEQTSTNTVTETVSTTTVPTAAAVAGNVPEPTTGYTSGAPVTVPEMKPTGDMAQAVKPGKPSEPSNGAAPTMTPTGNEREPYRPGPTGK
jgi:hypothetical protein